MFKQHPIWFGLGLTILPLFVLFLGYFNIHPEIYRSIPDGFGMQNDTSSSGIAWSDDEKKDPPLEYVSDSFRGIRITTETTNVMSFWDLWNKPKSQIEYEWRYKIKNLTDTTLEIMVIYKLTGMRSAIIASSEASEVVESGETIEIEHVGSMDYTDSLEVSGTSWQISKKVIP